MDENSPLGLHQVMGQANEQLEHLLTGNIFFNADARPAHERNLREIILILYQLEQYIIITLERENRLEKAHDAAEMEEHTYAIGQWLGFHDDGDAVTLRGAAERVEGLRNNHPERAYAFGEIVQSIRVTVNHLYLLYKNSRGPSVAIYKATLEALGYAVSELGVDIEARFSILQ